MLEIETHGLGILSYVTMIICIPMGSLLRVFLEVDLEVGILRQVFIWEMLQGCTYTDVLN